MRAIQSHMMTVDARYKSACLFICLAELVSRFGLLDVRDEFIVSPEDLHELFMRSLSSGLITSDFYVLNNQKILNLMCDYFKKPRVYTLDDGHRHELNIHVLKYMYKGPHFVLKIGDLILDPLGESKTRKYGYLAETRSYFID